MADFLVLSTWHGTVDRGAIVTIPQGKVIKDTEYNVSRLLSSGLRAIELEPAISAVLQQQTDVSFDVVAAVLQTLFDGANPVLASYFISSSAGTTMSPGTPVKMAGTTTAVHTMGLDHSANRLTNNGALKVSVGLSAAISLTCDTNNRIVSGFFAKNGSEVVSSEVQTKIGTGTDIEEMSVLSTMDLDPGEFVEVFLDLSGSGVMTGELAYVRAQGFSNG